MMLMQFSTKSNRSTNSKDKSKTSEPNNLNEGANPLPNNAANSTASLLPSGIPQLQKTIGNRAVTQLLKANAQPQMKQTPVIQGMFTPANKSIKNLADLNVALAALKPAIAPIAVTDFAAIAGVTGAILDSVIGSSSDSVYDTMVSADVIAALTPDLQAATAPPSGYTLENSSGTKVTAYVSNPNGHTIGKVAMAHIVEGRFHLSDKMDGAPKQTPYVHPNDSELYLVTDDGKHADGLSKYTVGKAGKVRAGVHIFS
jgi:hypothetical protein